MVDDLTQRGKPDQDRLNHNEPWEMKQLAAKFGITVEAATRYTKDNGPMRSKVEAAIQNAKKSA